MYSASQICPAQPSLLSPVARVFFLSLQGAPADLQIFTDQMVSTVHFCNLWEEGIKSLGERSGLSICVVESLFFGVILLQQVQQEQLESVMDWLSSQPRAAQLIDKDSTFLNTLEYYMGRYLKDVKQHHVKADKR